MRFRMLWFPAFCVPKIALNYVGFCCEIIVII